LRKEFSSIVKNLISSDSSFALLLGDISVGLFLNENEELPKNIYNLGVLEQSMISFAAGLSRGGVTPFVHTISAFLIERAYEQIKLDLRYNNNKIIMVSANGPFDYNKLGPTHHSSSDVPLIELLGSINIYLPGRVEDVKQCINLAIKSTNSSYIRLNSQKNLLSEIEPGIIYKKKNNSKSLLVFVGESLNNNQTSIPNIKEDWIYIFDIESLDINKIKEYQEIIFWEPYSKPLAAYKYKKFLSNKVKLTSYIYPESIQNGIFKSPNYLKIKV